MSTNITHPLGVVVTAAALAAVSLAGQAAAPAAAAKAAHPVTVYVGSTGVVAGRQTVTPINTATGMAGNRIRTATGTGPIVITPNGTTAYVASRRSDTVTPIRIATNKALKAVKVGSYPDAIAITPNSRTAYVANFRSDTVKGRPLYIAITP
ncbi:MAG TPA: beta-propeller fold lactonase family protein [Streptosporangiaceae bacterium]|nr:beta-propeller fold lactonase family protein [Streptosporangiaceae bacterium]